MANVNALPPIVLQTIEALRDKTTPEHIKFNHMKTLENIRDCCDDAINVYRKKSSNTRIK